MNNFNYTNLTPFKWFVLENFPFIEADFDALTEWQLFCKIGKEINKIINSQNIVGSEMENISQAFINLQTFVNNYFDNLDVQEEINNKLNEMAEDGTLAEIINQEIFAKLNKSSFTYKTFSEAVLDDLEIGKFFQTSGFYNENDEGNALYEVVETKSNVLDIPYNNKYAHLIHKDFINLRSLGFSENNDNRQENTNIFIELIKLFNNGIKIIIPTGIFPVFQILIDTVVSNIEICGNNQGSILSCNVVDGYCITFTNKCQFLNLHDFRIDGENVSSGIYISMANSFMQFKNLFLREVKNGFFANEMVYCYLDNVRIIANPLNNEFGFKIQGNEFVYMNNCSSQAHIGDNYGTGNMCELHDINKLFVNGCDFTENGGIALKYISDGATTNNDLHFTNCSFMRNKKCISIETQSSAIRNMCFENCDIVISGAVSDNVAVETIMTGTQKIIDLKFKNLSVRLEKSTYKPPVVFQENSISGICELEIEYSNISDLRFLQANNNSIKVLSNSNIVNGSKSFTGNGEQTIFNVILPDNFYPKSGILPILLLNTDLLNSTYKVRSTWYDSSNRLRCSIVFDTPPAQNTTFNVFYKLIV